MSEHIRPPVRFVPPPAERAAGAAGPNRGPDYRRVPLPVLRAQQGAQWARYLTADAGQGFFDLLSSSFALAHEITQAITGYSNPFAEELMYRLEETRRRSAARQQMAGEQLRAIEDELSLRRSTRQTLRSRSQQ